MAAPTADTRTNAHWIVGRQVAGSGETTRIGPMSSTTQQQRVNGYIERGVADGATITIGGRRAPDGLGSGAYVKPTIFADVAPDAVIGQEEIFGPVLSVIPYTDQEQAVEIANST